MIYTLLTSVYESELIWKVNNMLNDGWELYGSPFSIPQINDRASEYGQAMIKKNANPTITTI